MYDDTLPDHDNSQHDELLDRYLAGDLGSSERARLAEVGGSVVKALDTLRENAEVDTVRAKGAVLGRIQTAAPAKQAAKRYNVPSRWHLAWIAPVFVIAGLRLFSGALNTSSANEVVAYETAPGERARLQLPDGSKVTLAPSSKLRYAKSFGKGSRNIELEGLGVFTVINEGQPPFIVRSGGAEAKVLGTTFSVRRYAEDKSVKVVVAEGKVQVGNAKDSDRSVLTAGEAVDIADSGITSVDRNANVASELGWVSGRLSFRSTPLRNVVKEVNRMYGMDIRLDNPVLGTRSVTASIDAGLSPRGIASLLAGISGTRAQWRGPVVLFKE